MSPFRIRVATSGDWDALAEMRYRFRVEVGSPTETKSRFVRRCTSWMKKAFGADSSAWRCWVVDDGKQLLGHVCVQLFEKLPNKALSWCRAQDVEAVILWATAESRSLYRRCGLLESADILELRADTLR